MDKEKRKGLQKNSLLPLGVCLLTLGALVFYTLFFLNHLMHSDMAAEVILSKLLADRGELITKAWYYSTEIRILYSQLVMTPLFMVCSDFHIVKVLSIFIYLVLLILAAGFFAKRFRLSAASKAVIFMLLLAPWSNEYLDMMFLGNFYTSQTILMYVFLAFSFKERKEKKQWIIDGVLLSILSFLLGLSGLRYPACLFAPMLLALLVALFFEGERPRRALLVQLFWHGGLTVFVLFGFLVNKLYFAKYYSFDQTPVVFVPLSEVPDRAMTAVCRMLELFGYRDGLPLTSPLGLVNVLKAAFFLYFIYLLVRLWRNRQTMLDLKERVFLYYFVFLFLINLYMLIFTTVLMQYRYWIPVYIIAIYLAGISWDRSKAAPPKRTIAIVFLCIAACSCLYGELWQDVKFDDCAKREGYMAFLEKEQYTFGYATFWNGPVTEYLSNGTIHVGCLGEENKPYEWLTPKAYYQKGFHEGKTFLLLARTEEAGMLKGDFTVMEDAKRVYADEYYAVYEGEGMYIFP